VIIVGQGARGADRRLRALAERLGAPVLTTFRAKGLVPDTHPLGAACWAVRARRWRPG
jgi:thiamine pyrophosphate-dependent acetolactate synthase large subunit-like protein